jgi:glutaredoxin-like YruB-family protein
MNKIIVYSLPTCGYCQSAKKYFKNLGVEFTEVSVDKDPEAQKEMIIKSGQFSVPVIDINGQILVGFQKSSIDALLGL